MDREHILFVYTLRFPYQKGEVFFEMELPYLAEFFEKIYIIPDEPGGEARVTPDNVEVLHWEDHVRPNSKFRPKRLVEALNILSEQLSVSSHRAHYFKHFFHYFRFCLQRIAEAGSWEEVVHGLKDGRKDLHYFYWFRGRIMELSYLRRKKKVPGLVSRVLGFDLYHERTSLGFFPLRSYQMKGVDRVLTISDYATSYLTGHYPKFAEKIDTAYMGVDDEGTNPFSSPQEKGFLRIVTCSNLYPIKRVDLLVKGLAEVSEQKVEWVHFGTGKDEEKVRELVKHEVPSHVSCSMMGHVEHDRILEYYRNHPIDLFANTSSSEGLPVSIMEALSFSIPVLATDVGGVQEEVDRERGYLLASNPSPQEIARAIETHANLAPEEASRMRSNAREHWKDHFDAQKNYRELPYQLLSVLSDR